MIWTRNFEVCAESDWIGQYQRSGTFPERYAEIDTVRRDRKHYCPNKNFWIKENTSE
jgi:hypothetical protein